MKNGHSLEMLHAILKHSIYVKHIIHLRNCNKAAVWLKHKKKIEACEIRYSRKVLGVTRRDRIRNNDIRRIAGTISKTEYIEVRNKNGLVILCKWSLAKYPYLLKVVKYLVLKYEEDVHEDWFILSQVIYNSVVCGWPD